MSLSNKKNAESPVEKLLQRLARQFSSSSSSQRPPDAAGAALGRELGRFISEKDEGLVWKALCRAEHMPSSLPYALIDAALEHHQQQQTTKNLEWLSKWLIQTEEHLLKNDSTRRRRASTKTGADHLLEACINGYALYGQPRALMDTYRRLHRPSSQAALLRKTLQSAFQKEQGRVAHDNDLGTIPYRLSPLLSASLLAPSAKEQKAATLQALTRNLWVAWTRADATFPECFYLLEWMTEALSIHIDVMTNAVDWDDGEVVANCDIAEGLLSELVILAQALMERFAAQDQQYVFRVLEWIDVVLYDELPRLLLQSSDPVFLPAMQGLIHIFAPYPFDSSTALRLAVAMLSIPNSVQREQCLGLLLCGIPESRSSFCILQAVSSICFYDCEKFASMLSKHLESVKSDLRSYEPKSRCNLVELYDLPEGSQLLDTVVQLSSFTKTNLSPSQQLATLLFGIVSIDEAGDETKLRLGFGFLTRLLFQYPHLAMTLMPPVLDRVNKYSYDGDPKQLIMYLEFICEALVLDPHCAQEVWEFVGVKMMRQDVPLTVRVAVLRMFPKLCEANRKLYRRVIDSLGSSLSSSQPEIRLAVAATLADLAKNDQIRDVSDVIGWVQTLLTEEHVSRLHTLLVHYAILTLHYLVVAQELDFNVVIKVLNKRLCPVSNVSAIMQLPSIVHESLALLLGDGEVDDGESSEEGEDEPDTKILSPQVMSVVRTLIDVGVAYLDKGTFDATDARVVRNIFESLSNYSIEALSLDEEAAKGALGKVESLGDTAGFTDSEGRYIDLRNLALAGMKFCYEYTKVDAEIAVVSDKDDGNRVGSNDSFVLLARKLLEFEELALGSTMWKKHGRRNPLKSSSVLPSKIKKLIGCLPEPSSIKKIGSERPSSPGTAISFLMSADANQLSSIRDNGDAALESTDPLFLVFAVQAYLLVSVRVLSKTSTNDIGNLIAEVRSWNEVFVEPDTMWLALAALNLYIPCDMRVSGSTKVTFNDEITSTILDAFRNQRFEKGIVSKICIALAAVGTIRTGSLKVVEETVDVLEKSVREYGGQQCFGSYYGLALVARGLQEYLHSDLLRSRVSDAKRTILRICGFLVDELLSCYEQERSEIFINLIACLKSGVATSDLVDSMSDLEPNSISLLMTKHVVARALFISSALCLPALAGLDGALHLAALRMMEAFEWGSGKGIALPPMLRACQETNLFTPAEMKQIYKNFVDTFEDRIDNGESGIDSEGLDDIFYALNGTLATPMTHEIRKTLVGNHDLFDDDGCILSLIAMIVSIVPVPCFGASYFCVPPLLRTQTSDGDIQSVVEILRDAVLADETGKYSDTAMILMGFLASMRNQDELVAVSASLPEVSLKRGSSSDSVSISVDFDRLPSAASGTFLAALLDEAQAQLQSGNPIAESFLVRFMGALECLSLPESFAKSFLMPVLEAKNQKDSMMESSVSLLCSQLRGRRRAVFDGRQFMLSALSFANSNRERWTALRKNGSTLEVFCSSLSEVCKKFPPDAAGQALRSVWLNCIADLPDDTGLVMVFLENMRQLLASTTIPPKLTKVVRQTLSLVSKDLASVPVETLLARPNLSKPSFLEAYIKCLLEIPHTILDEEEYITLQNASDIASDNLRALSLSLLVEHGYFDSERESEELSNLTSWIATMLQEGERIDAEMLRIVMFSFASASRRESQQAKRDRLPLIFDLVLTAKKKRVRFGLQWLGALLAFWTNSIGSDGEISFGHLCLQEEIYPVLSLSPGDVDYALDVMVEDLPANLASFCFSEKISAIISNRLNRLHSDWLEKKVDNELLMYIRRAVFSCQSGVATEDTFLALSSAALVLE